MSASPSSEVLSLRNMRFPLAVLIVFIHARFTPLVGADGMPVLDFLQNLISGTVAAVAVPAFFALSGYLYFLNVSRWDGQIFWDKTRRRVRTLFLPYVVWNTMKLISLLILTVYASGLSGVGEVLIRFHGWHIYWDCNPDFDAPILLATWFLRDLMLLSLLAPLFYFVIRRCGVWPLCLVLVCYLADVWPTQHILGALTVGSFLFGATVSLRGCDICRLFGRHRLPIGILSVILLAVSMAWPACQLLTRMYVLCATLSVFHLFGWLTERYGSFVPDCCTRASYFVYLGHSFLTLSAFRWLTMHCLLSFPGQMSAVISYFLAPVLTILFLVAVYSVFNRIPNTQYRTPKS